MTRLSSGDRRLVWRMAADGGSVMVRQAHHDFRDHRFELRVELVDKFVTLSESKGDAGIRR